MGILGLASSVAQAAPFIDTGRKGFAVKWKADCGRISYEDGLEIVLAAFQIFIGDVRILINIYRQRFNITQIEIYPKILKVG